MPGELPAGAGARVEAVEGFTQAVALLTTSTVLDGAAAATAALVIDLTANSCECCSRSPQLELSHGACSMV